MTRRPRRWLLLAAMAAGLSVAVLLTEPFERPARSNSAAPAHPRAASDRLVRRSVFLGRSVRGRPIYAMELGDPDNERRVLAVGVIHGNETAGRLIDQRLASRSPPKEALVWTINALNPDGVAAGIRQNANAVDLNRNFPWHWRPLGTRGDLQYSGPRPLSEPEARIARSLILRVRPGVTIWFHPISRQRRELAKPPASRHDRVRGRVAAAKAVPTQRQPLRRRSPQARVLTPDDADAPRRARGRY